MGINESCPSYNNEVKKHDVHNLTLELVINILK